MLALGQLTSYRIKYYDCSRPEKVIPYSLEHTCAHEQAPTSTPVRMTLLQKRRLVRNKGYSCSVTKSTFTLYCGAFSHTKIATPPKIEVSTNIPARECETLINTEKYKTLEGGTHYVPLGQETLFWITEHGLIHTGANSITCEGQQMRIGDNIVENLLEIAQYRVILQTEEYLMDGNNVEVLADHVKLPCNAKSKG